MNQSSLVRTLLILVLILMTASLSRAADEPNLGEIVYEAKGYVVPAKQVSVSPKVLGQVVESMIEEGKRVKAGDILARLDPTEYEIALRVARAKLKLAEGELAKAKESGTKADLAIAEAKVELAQAKVALAQYRVECTVVRAPVSGTVVMKQADVGSLLDTRSLNIRGILCDLADFQNMEIQLRVQDKDFAKIAIGQKCQIRLDAFPEKTYGGNVSRILPIADRALGAVEVRVRVEIPKNDESFREEMGAIVSIGSKR
jgi:RND family efflux transporter MFP subunit